MNQSTKKILKIATILLLLGMVVAIYFIFDPAQARFFPPCPFTFLTGFNCPGCGSQRAIHQLLHLNIPKAFFYNPLMILSLPYVIAGIYFEYFGGNTKYPHVRKILFGRTAMWIAFVIIILYWISRNLLHF